MLKYMNENARAAREPERDEPRAMIEPHATIENVSRRHVLAGALLASSFVLAVRLFANLFAGHMVLATILLFIPAVAGPEPRSSASLAAPS